MNKQVEFKLLQTSIGLNQYYYCASLKGSDDKATTEELLYRAFANFFKDENVTDRTKEIIIQSAIDHVFNGKPNAQTLQFLKSIRKMMADEFEESQKFFDELNTL